MRLNSALPFLVLLNVVFTFAFSPVAGLVLPETITFGIPGQTFLRATVNVNALPTVEQSRSVTPLLKLAPPGLAGFSSLTPDQAVSPVSIASTAGSSSVNSSAGFDGLNQVQSCNCVPPDVQVAAGPSNVIEMVNVEAEVFSKQGSSIKTMSLSSFFSTGADSISDPKVLFDAPSGRFFASILDISLGTVTLAVSTSSDPTGTWNIYVLSAAGNCPDQPIIGINDDKFVASANDFTSCTRSGRFAGNQFWVLNKSEMVAGAAKIDLASFGPNSSLFSVHPVHSLSSTTTEFMVSTAAGSKVTSVKFFSVTGVPPSIVAVNTVGISIKPTTLPPGGVQPGTNVLVNTDDGRVEDAVFFQGKIWYGLNDGCVPVGDSVTRSCLRLTQINTSTSTIVQDFDFGASGQYFFYPALRVDSSGSLDIVYGYSSSTIFPSLAITGQTLNDALGSLAPPKTIKLGSADETTGRYGDYFGAGLDASNPTFVWVAGEYVSTAGGVWSTFIANMSITSRDFTFSVNPSVRVTSPGFSATFNITLTAVGGFSGNVSLSATVSPTNTNGPTAVLNPTSVLLSTGGSTGSTLVVSTTSAAPAGNYSVTVIGTSGSLTHSVVVSFELFDFFLSNSGGISVNQGGSGFNTISISLLGGPSEPVSLSCSAGLPAGASCIFLPASGSPAFTSSATISASSSTPPGSYTITVNGSGGGQNHTTQFTLTVSGGGGIGGRDYAR